MLGINWRQLKYQITVFAKKKVSGWWIGCFFRIGCLFQMKLDEEPDTPKSTPE
jgi:hypothetical protein